MSLVELFASQGHSGGSASVVLAAFGTVARYGVLTPLTGEDSEWMEVGPNVWQNVRLSSVFREEDGRAYDIEAIVHRLPDGKCYLRGGERHYIEFPYTPKKVYVDVEE